MKKLLALAIVLTIVLAAPAGISCSELDLTPWYTDPPPWEIMRGPTGSYVLLEAGGKVEKYD